MDSVAALITAMAALVTALAWPVAVFFVVWIFRKEVRLAIVKLTGLFDRMKSVKVFEFEAQLDKFADQATSGEDAKGAISPSEIIAADRIKDELAEIGEQTIASQLDRLCIEYDTIRRVTPSSDQRTRAMTQILVRMRLLGPSMSKFIANYMSSGSAGSRLAAVAMMQIQPDKADLGWLVRRFGEEAPFVFYHAALALQSIANSIPNRLPEVKAAATSALNMVRSFEGEPDSETIYVLEALLQDRASGKYV